VFPGFLAGVRMQRRENVPASFVPVACLLSLLPAMATAEEAGGTAGHPGILDPWSVRAVVDHSFGSAFFVPSDPALRVKPDKLIMQGYSVGGSFAFDVLERPLAAKGWLSASCRLGAAPPQSESRFDPSASLMLMSDHLVRESFTGLELLTGVRGDVALGSPTQMGQFASGNADAGTLDPLFQDRGRALGRGWLGLSRTFGAVRVQYAFTAAKRLGGSDAGNNALGSTASVPGTLTFPQAEHAFQHLVALEVRPVEWLSASYGLKLVSLYYPVQDINTQDPYTSYADASDARVDQRNPVLNITLVPLALLAIGDSPVDLRLSVGIQALHRARTADNKNIMWPFFYQSFAVDRASSSSGSVYLRVEGTL
jgi:hypothetical protein